MLKTYKCKFHLGDIPGDQCVEWWTEEDWAEWREYVEELKASGEYGKEKEVSIILKHDPRFDNPSPWRDTGEYYIIDL